MYNINLLQVQQIKYLGVIIASNLKFYNHFIHTKNKLHNFLIIFNKLYSNSNEHNYKKAVILYKSILLSNIKYCVIVYKKMLNSKKIINMLHSVQRLIAIRMTKAYKTTSFRSVIVLTGIQPLELEIKRHINLFLIKNNTVIVQDFEHIKYNNENYYLYNVVSNKKKINRYIYDFYNEQFDEIYKNSNNRLLGVFPKYTK